jgi:uncharacterized protein YciI
MFTSRRVRDLPIPALSELWRCATTPTVATFLVLVRRIGPRWDQSRPMEEQSDWDAHASFMDGLVDAGFIVLGGPLADEERVVHVVEAESEDAIRATLARDPWSETHLVVDSIDPWTLRLDSRRSA